MGDWVGHSVLQVPVGPLERWVRERARHYDPDWVSTDPAFAHAHVTALAPWLSTPTAADLAVVGEVAAATPVQEFDLHDVTAFPDGIVHAPPRPESGFADLTSALVEAFPQCPPYDGRQADVVPHVSLDHLSPAVSIASTRALLGGLLPARCVATTLQLAWYEAGACRVLASWPLGREVPGSGRR